MSDWLEFLGESEAPGMGEILVIGSEPALVGKARELAETRGCGVTVAAPDPTDRLFHLGAHTSVRMSLEPTAIAELCEQRGADILLGPQTQPAAFLLGRLAQRGGGGLVKAFDVAIDPDTGRLVCRREAYGGRLILDLMPAPPACALLDVARLPEPFEDASRTGTTL